MLPQQYCLRWRYHQSNLQTMFSQLLEREAFCDVTLACEGRTIKAHKIVLSACSTFFDNILSQYEEKDPILIMKDVKYVDIKCLVEFMYKGEINVEHCHLITLLKTAEELKIKGLAEVSLTDNLKEYDMNHEVNGMNSIQTALQSVAAVMTSPQDVKDLKEKEKEKEVKEKDTSSTKRKRGRPPIDDYDYMQAAKLAHATMATSDYSNDAPSPENQSWDEEGPNGEDDPLKMRPEFKLKIEYQPLDDSDGTENDIQSQNQRNETASQILKHYQIASTASSTALTNTNTTNSHVKSTSSSSNSHQTQPSASTNTTTSILTAALEKEWPDVVKMNDYLNTGRRQQFWEEPFTKRVMDAIKHKNLEMKIAAELLGVSYGTLYGRYRDAYGCLKHPYRIKDFWTEQGPTEILLKLKRKEISLHRAAEQMNVTAQTLSNYLVSMAVLDNETGGRANQYEEIEWEERGEDDNDIVTPDVLYQQITASTSGVLANCPDITIIKKERVDANSTSSRVNNNSDHSDTTH